MRAGIIGIMLSAMLAAGPAAAYDTYDSRSLFANPMFIDHGTSDVAYDPRNCAGVDWDDEVVLARVTAGPRVNFIKSPDDETGKAPSCPAAGGACRKKSYLVPGDFVLAGRTRGDFTCISYRSPVRRIPAWRNGWLPRAALSPVAPMPAPQLSDWLGTWSLPNGSIAITDDGIGGRLHIVGEMAVATMRDVHTGTLDAQVKPGTDNIAFLEDGWLPFETNCDSGCRVRMRRVGPFLLVQDNGDCGGAGASFTGLYRRSP
ncbi:hypothetical protein [Bradyrhizobium sp. Cp5.3]|uniref:hypothetical protein n=1 Tax=Bradyrhizobium sp. Cp5.3 TaxID=443598 RepID=UPI000401851E|nr:hypothetical protein [Bradyrhizobium sp. Cp5.3]